VVVTRNPAWQSPDVVVARSFADAIAKSAGDTEVFVIGGEQIFREALAEADRIYLTEIDRDFPGDVIFPALEQGRWQEAASETLRDEAAGLTYRNRILDRRS
jgi:dihydrofolate reductase